MLVLFAVAICIGIPVYAYGPTVTVEYDTDRQGGDYKNMDVAGLEECMDACVNDQNCAAFTFVRKNKQPPNYNNASPKCWLKKSVPGKRSDDCCITGIKK